MSDPPLFFAQTSHFQLSPRLQGSAEPVSGYGDDVLVDGSEGTADQVSDLGGLRTVTFAAMAGGAPDPSPGTDHGSSRGLRHGGRPCSRSVAPANTFANPAGWPAREDLGASEEEARAVPGRIPVLVPEMPPAEMVLPYLRRMDEAGWYTNFGPLVGQLEERLANQLTGSERDLAVRVATSSSGTTAIELAMAALAPRRGTRIMIPGFNFHAAVGLAQLERWDEIKRRRQALARQYAYELALNGNRVCVQQGWGRFGPANLTVALGPAAMPHGIADKLEAAGIETRRWYCLSLTRHPVFRQLPRAATDGDALGVCESLCQCTLGLPFHGCMTAEDVTTVCRHLSTLIQDP